MPVLVRRAKHESRGALGPFALQVDFCCRTEMPPTRQPSPNVMPGEMPPKEYIGPSVESDLRSSVSLSIGQLPIIRIYGNRPAYFRMPKKSMVAGVVMAFAIP